MAEPANPRVSPATPRVSVWGVRVTEALAGAAHPGPGASARASEPGWLASCCDEVVVVGAEDGHSPPGSLIAALRCGLRQVPDHVEVVALVDPEGYERSGPAAVREMCSRLEGHVAAVARGLPVTDALKRVSASGSVGAGSDRLGGGSGNVSSASGGHGARSGSVSGHDDAEVITESVDRAGLFAPRTPQVVRVAALTDALAAGAEPTGDPATFLARSGMWVEVVPAKSHAEGGR